MLNESNRKIVFYRKMVHNAALKSVKCEEPRAEVNERCVYPMVWQIYLLFKVEIDDNGDGREKMFIGRAFAENIRITTVLTSPSSFGPMP